jgi:hypothetical protein
MHKNQRVSDMAVEVLARQAMAQAKQTGEPFEDALERVLKTEAGGSLRGFATGRTAARGRSSGKGISHGSVGESVSRPLGSNLWLWRLSSGS